MLKHKWLGSLLILSLIVILLSGCGLYGPEEAMEIDPPPASLEIEDLNPTIEVTNTEGGNQTSSTSTENASEMVTLTIYYFDQQGDVVPLPMAIPKVEGIGKEVLRFMTMGGPAEATLPEGFRPVLPAGTVSDMNVKFDQKLAIVDFSKEFLSYQAANSAEEKKILDAITWTLTEFPTVEQVEIRVNGYPLEVMPTWNTPVVGPLSRLDGINLELANNIHIGQTTPVTLYFQKGTEAGSYLIPVTRLIPQTEDIAKATLEQLILGPKQDSRLIPALLPTTKVLDVSYQDDILVADFDKELLGFNDAVSQEIIEMIVLSLTENTEASSVQIMVNGQTEQSEALAKPIFRPNNINKSAY